jgi:hypothetical protein
LDNSETSSNVLPMASMSVSGVVTHSKQVPVDDGSRPPGPSLLPPPPLRDAETSPKKKPAGRGLSPLEERDGFCFGFDQVLKVAQEMKLE